MKEVRKRGVSPVIATVLLIALVIIIALIIFLFMKGIGEETLTKFGSENVKLACTKVDFDASYSDDSLVVSNLGEVPIFSMRIRLDQEGGNYEIKDLGKDYGGWPPSGLAQGGVASISLPLIGGIEKITLTPVLIGKTKQGAKKSYPCDQGSPKKEIKLA